MKAQTSMDWVIGMVLLIIFLLSGFAWIYKIADSGLDRTAINQQCFQSVSLNAQRRVPVVQTQTVDVQCPTVFVTLGLDEAVWKLEAPKNGEIQELDRKDYSSFNCPENDDVDDREEACRFRAINKVIADEMATCWKNMHQGHERVFSLYTNNRQCMVCSVVYFDNEMREEYGSGLIGFQQPESEYYSLDLYMRNNNNIRITGETNYYEYTMDPIDRVFQYPYYDYDVTKDYAIVFVALNKDAVDLVSADIWRRIKGDAADEEGNFINTLEFVPNEEVPTICDEWG